MPFIEGQSGNPTGKPLGVKNKAGKPIRDLITAFVNDNWPQAIIDFKTLKPSERLQFLEKILKYVVPSLQAVNVTTDLEQQLEVLSDQQLEDLMNKLLEHHSQ
jgi:hypothetical protein